MKLNIKAFALTCAILWAFSVLLIAWWPIWIGQVPSPGAITTIKLIYIGFNYTYVGGLIGFCWGFVDGLIGGAIFAWLYNWLSNKFS